MKKKKPQKISESVKGDATGERQALLFLSILFESLLSSYSLIFIIR